MGSVNPASMLLLSIILILTIISHTSSHERRVEFGCTEVPTESVIYYWQLKSARFLLEMGGNNVYSPAISSRNHTDRWKIEFDPNNEANPDYIGILLHLIDTEAAGILTRVNISLTSLPEKAPSLSFIHQYDKLEGWGSAQFISRTSILSQMMGDDLEIRCHLVLVNNQTTTPCQRGSEVLELNDELVAASSLGVENN